LNCASSISAVGADLDLQLHHVAAGRRADYAGADLGVLGLVEGPDVAGVLVVVDDLLAVCHWMSPCFSM
jgi:hypothetical protein